MGFDIVTMGPLICEVMRKELDKPLDRPLSQRRRGNYAECGCKAGGELCHDRRGWG